MHQIFMTQVAGQWIVLVESEGRRQEYVCESLEQAQRWLALLGAPVRHHEHVKARAVA